MANEFKHKTVGTQLTQAEWEAVGGHVFDSQAAGDIPYASSTSQLSRLGIGTAGKVLMVNSGASAPEWSSALTGVTSLGTLTTLTVDNIIINGTNIGHTSDTDSIAIASDGVVTMNQIPVFSAGINVSGGSIAGTLSTASQTNITGVGTISTGTWQGTAIASGYIAADAITGAKIADDALDSEHYTDGSIDTAHLAADAITGAKIADDAINSEHYTDGSVDTAHIADNQVTLAKMAGLTRGSLIIGDASGDPSALTKGSANYILTSDGTDIAWAAAPDATNSSHVLVTDNESTDEENLVTFVEGATSSTGNVGLEMDGNLTYNPSSGTLTATAFAGNLTGNVTGNASGTAATVTSGTQANITTLANLTTSGALNAGSITSGFGTIDTGSSAISTTGAVRTGDINLGHASDTTLARSASGEVTIEGSLIKKVGVEHIWVPATAMTPSESNGCGTLTTLETTAGRPDISHLPFDNSADENAQFSISLPKSWDETSDLTCTVYWTSSRDVSNEDVTWAIAPICFGNNDDVDTAFPTPTIITTDTAQGQEFMNITSSVAIDVAGSPAAGDLCFFEISRDVSDTDGTTLAADALLIGVKIFYTTNAATDA